MDASRDRCVRLHTAANPGLAAIGSAVAEAQQRWPAKET